MSMTDPIADLLTRIRNAQLAKHRELSVPASKMRAAIVRILKDEGYVEDFESDDTPPQGTIRIRLKYLGGDTPAITGLQRISRPGRRVYRGKGDVPTVLNGLGIVIVSTPNGVMTGAKSAEHGVGGEVLCSIW